LSRRFFYIRTKIMPSAAKKASRIERATGRHLRWISRWVLMPASVVLSLVVGEGLVRLVAAQSLILLRPDIWIPADQAGWRHMPNVDLRVNTGEREVRWKTDDQGFRIGANRPQASAMTLVALGDSFVEALQVEDEDTM